MATPKPRFDGPIPGENYTSDTKNYPWHRPPDITDYDEAVEYVVNKISEQKAVTALTSLMEAGANLTTLVSMINMINVGRGKYPIDISILIAGPIARFIKIIADKNDIDVKVGNEDERQVITLEYLKGMAGFAEDIVGDDDQTESSDAVTESVSRDQLPSGGIMGVSEENVSQTASATEQRAMLGLTDDDEEEEA